MGTGYESGHSVKSSLNRCKITALGPSIGLVIDSQDARAISEVVGLYKFATEGSFMAKYFNSAGLEELRRGSFRSVFNAGFVPGGVEEM